MKVSISEAKAQLAELVRVAEAGDEVILTRHGKSAAKLVPVVAVADEATRRRLIEDLQAAAAKAPPGSSAERSQDFLYDDDGMPG